MRKYLLLTALLTVFLTPALGEVFYQIDANRTSVEMNTTLELECNPETSNCPVNRWRLNWDIPDNSQIMSIEDSLGGIEDYTVKGGQVSIVTNSGSRRSSETVKLRTRMEKDAEEIHKGLYKRNLNLAGFSGDKTSGVVKNPDLISGWMGTGFKTSYTDSNMSFTGTGSTSLRINFGWGNKSEYYEFFGGNPDNTSLAYEISVGMTGLTQGFERFPVALMDPDNYEESVVGWSSGEYVGGSFRMRKHLEGEFLPVLAHETVHGLNQRELKWDGTSSTWIDEGTAKYVETLVKLHLQGKERTRQLFGGDTTYTERRDGTRYRVTAPSSGDPDELWKYYQQEKDFMKNWNPHDYPEERSFGYAYSELIIRNQVARENGTLRELYMKINPGREINSNQEKWNLVSDHIDLTPCKYESRERFDACLEEINKHNYSIYRAQNITRGQETVDLTPLEIKKREKTRGGLDVITGNRSNSTIVNATRMKYRQIARSVLEVFTDLIQSLKGLVGGAGV